MQCCLEMIRNSTDVPAVTGGEPASLWHGQSLEDIAAGRALLSGGCRLLQLLLAPWVMAVTPAAVLPLTFAWLRKLWEQKERGRSVGYPQEVLWGAGAWGSIASSPAACRARICSPRPGSSPAFSVGQDAELASQCGAAVETATTELSSGAGVPTAPGQLPKLPTLMALRGSPGPPPPCSEPRTPLQPSLGLPIHAPEVLAHSSAHFQTTPSLLQ